MLPDGRVAFWNEAAGLLYGYESGEILEKNVSILIPKPRAHEVRELQVQVTPGRMVRAFHTEHVVKAIVNLAQGFGCRLRTRRAENEL